MKRKQTPYITNELEKDKGEQSYQLLKEDIKINVIDYNSSDNETENRSVKEMDKLNENNEMIEIMDEINLNNNSEVEERVEEENEKLLIPEKFIRDDEMNKLIFTKNGIVNLFKDFENQTNWISLYNKDNLILHYIKGSILNDSFLLGRLQYTLPKSLFSKPIDIDLLMRNVYDPELRTKYDKAIKEYKIYEKGDNYFIFRIWYHSPLMFISERDAVDKRIFFIRDGVYYSIATSLQSYEQVPVDNKVVRVKTFINSTKLREDDNNFYFTSYTQLDAKMPIPESLINITIPLKSAEWYKNYINHLKKTINEIQ